MKHSTKRSTFILVWNFEWIWFCILILWLIFNFFWIELIFDLWFFFERLRYVDWCEFEVWTVILCCFYARLNILKPCKTHQWLMKHSTKRSTIWRMTVKLKAIIDFQWAAKSINICTQWHDAIAIEAVNIPWSKFDYRIICRIGVKTWSNWRYDSNFNWLKFCSIFIIFPRYVSPFFQNSDPVSYWQNYTILLVV